MARRVKGLYKRGHTWWASYKDLTGRVVRASTGKTDYDEALEFLANRKREVKAGIEYRTAKVINCTFRELTEEYKKWAQNQKSFYSKKYLIEIVTREFGDIPINNFTTLLLEQYQSSLIQKGRKSATANRLYATISHIFTKGNDWGVVSEELLKRVRKVKMLKEDNSRCRYLTEEEYKALLKACDDHIRPIVTVAVNTGCRKSEILKLRWDNVNLKAGLLTLTPGQTKNAEMKVIPLNSALVELFRSMPRRLNVSYVFFNPKTLKPYTDIKNAFRKALTNAKTKDFRFHDLRHTFGSHLTMSGAPLLTVAELMGHKNLKMTRRYSHLSAEHKLRAVEALNDAMTGATSQFTSQSGVGGGF